MGMTRTEHMAWAKERALQYLDTNDYAQALTSMLSDLGKHPETESHMGIRLTGIMMMGGHLNTVAEVRKHIEGFN